MENDAESGPDDLSEDNAESAAIQQIVQTIVNTLLTHRTDLPREVSNGVLNVSVPISEFNQVATVWGKMRPALVQALNSLTEEPWKTFWQHWRINEITYRVPTSARGGIWDAWFDEDEFPRGPLVEPTHTMIQLKVAPILQEDIDILPSLSHALTVGRVNDNQLRIIDETTCAWTHAAGRQHNQDGYCASPHGFAVADGIAGGQDGAKYAETVLKLLALNEEGHFPFYPLLQEIRRVLLRQAKLALRGGTTLAMARETIDSSGERWIEMAHVGDTTPLLLNAEGELVYVGIPQSHKGQALRAGVTNTEMKQWLEGRIRNGPEIDLSNREIRDQLIFLLYPDHGIDNCISLHWDLGHPETARQKITSGMTLFLLSDGVTDVVSLYEIAQFFKNYPFQEACCELQALVLGRQRMIQGLSEPGANRPLVQIAPEVYIEIGRIFEGSEGDNATFVAKRYP